MRVICSWCGQFIKKKEPLWNKSISYGICEECYERVIDEIKKFKEQEDKEKDYSRPVFSEFGASRERNRNTRKRR